MNPILSQLIAKANEKAKNDFMDFPDYDQTNPITTMPEALTVLLFDYAEDFELSEVYDFFNCCFICRENLNS